MNLPVAGRVVALTGHTGPTDPEGDRPGERTDLVMNVSSYSALDASVLVLNKMFLAVHVISVRRAFCLLFKDLAEVVTLEDGQYKTYDFATWREVSEYRARNFRQEEDDWVRTANAKSRRRASSGC